MYLNYNVQMYFTYNIIMDLFKYALKLKARKSTQIPTDLNF